MVPPMLMGATIRLRIQPGEFTGVRRSGRVGCLQQMRSRGMPLWHTAVLLSLILTNPCTCPCRSLQIVVMHCHSLQHEDVGCMKVRGDIKGHHLMTLAQTAARPLPASISASLFQPRFTTPLQPGDEVQLPRPEGPAAAGLPGLPVPGAGDRPV